MKRGVIFNLLLLLLLLGCKPAGTAKVEECFSAYKAALLKADGASAVMQVSKGTLDEYQKYRDWAVSGSETKVKALSTINKFQVLLLRQRIDAATLKKMSGPEVFKFAVDNGWIGKDGSVRAGITDIVISSLRATAKVTQNGKPTRETFNFIQEDGVWRLDLLPTLQSTDQRLKAAITGLGVSEEDYIFSLIESVSGQKVSQKIWKPLD